MTQPGSTSSDGPSSVPPDDIAQLVQQPLGRRWWGYLKLSGPGWIQSAFTLGAGTLGSSLFLGALLGYSLLWIQPVAMACGIIMFSAVAYQVLWTDKRPIRAVYEHVHPAMAWGWGIASLLASLIWAMPQYSVSVSVVEDATGRSFAGVDSLIPSLAILALLIVICWNYDNSSAGVRWFENITKVLVAIIIISFVAVVVATGINWAATAQGFLGFEVPRAGQEFEAWRPAAHELASRAAALGKAPPNLMAKIGDMGFESMLGGFAAAVGINMTFLFPYSLRRRNWTAPHTGLARFDLWVGMFVPFLITVTCIVIASANRFHGQMTLDQLVPGVDQQLAAGMLELAKPGARQMSQVLENLAGPFMARIVFGAGVLGMTISSIAMQMLVGGFVATELFGARRGSLGHRVALLSPGVVGMLGPLVWSKYQFYMAVPTSVINLTFLPIAYISFFILHNSKSYLGEARPRGARRWGWNLAMGVSIALVTAGALYAAVGNMAKLFGKG
jgi:hypothetical protein